MKEQKYRIIFKGEIIPNADIEEVKQKLAAFYKVDSKEIESLFSGKNFVLKENVNLDDAQNFMYQLEQIGALCQLVEMETQSKKDPTTDTADKTPETAADEKEIIEKPVPEKIQSELHYQLFFKGETIQGKDIAEVKTNLSMFYRVKPDELAGLFTGKPVAVTPAPTDFWTAVSYLNRFLECGATAYLETVESPGTVKEAADKYKIVYWGELQEGADLLSVKNSMATLFKVPAVVVDKLFLEKPVLTRTDLSLESARSFKADFEKTGARCQLLQVSETPHPPAPSVSEQDSGAAVSREAAAPSTRIPGEDPGPSSPSPAPIKVIALPPRAQPEKKINIVTLLVIAVAIFAVFIIFKAITGKSSEPEPAAPEQTVTGPDSSTTPPETRPAAPLPQTPQNLSTTRLKAEPTKTFECPRKYFSVALPQGYMIINESKEKRSKFLFNYSPNITVTISAYPITEKWKPEEAMFAKVTDLESGTGDLSRLDISSYDLVNFNGLDGYEIFLERGTQLVHLYDVVSPDNILFSIRIVSIGDNNRDNHDILNAAVRENLKY